jgi:transposase
MAMTTLAEFPTLVTAGVDTHRDVHMVAALDQRGAQLGVRPFPTDPFGHDELLRWLKCFGDVERVGIEGTGTYGASLTRYLNRQGVAVVEVSCPNRQERRSHGKSDPVDAVAAVRAAQSGKATAQPKARTGNVEAIRALRLVRRSATRDRTASINQMRALVVTGPDDLRQAFRGLTIRKLISGAVRLRAADPTTRWRDPLRSTRARQAGPVPRGGDQPTGRHPPPARRPLRRRNPHCRDAPRVRRRQP